MTVLPAGNLSAKLPVKSAFLQSSPGSQDNTFANARALGVLSRSSTASRFQARGSIGKSDRIDIFKLTAAVGASSSGGTQSLNVQKGAIRTSLFIDYGLGPQLLFRGRVPQGTYSFASGAFGALPIPATFYVVFDRPTQDTQYQYRAVFQP